MLSAYETPIMAAVVALIIIGFIIAIPWLILSYRKYGFFSIWQTLVIFSFIFYILAAYFIVILPLPEVRDTCAIQDPTISHFQPIPFYFLMEMIQGSPFAWTSPSTYLSLIKHPSFLPAFLNTLILFPLGVYMYYFRGKKLTAKKMFLIGFFVSLFFEVTQITGLYWIYTCPYRTFNVDDLILNTLGAGVGFMIAPAILALFPSQDKITAKSEAIFKSKHVRPLPQALALVIDYFIVYASWIVISALFQLTDDLARVIYMLLGLFILQFIWPLMKEGQTIGTNILRFRLIQIDRKQTRTKAFFKRWVALIAPFFMFELIRIILEHAMISMESPFYAFRVFFDVGLILFLIVMGLVLFIHVLRVLFGKGERQFFFDAASSIKANYNK